MATRNGYSLGYHVDKYRSGLEVAIADQLNKANVVAHYEGFKVPYIVPESKHRYCPDWLLPNGIIIEAKGLWDVDDRKKHLLLKDQYPDLDIRFVFSSSRTKLYKGSKTTYADYCIKNGWQFADKLIPKSWLKESPNKKAMEIINKLYPKE